MSDDDRYCTAADLSQYSTLSIRQLQRYAADRAHPLPVHRIGGRVLYLKSEFDQWLREHEAREATPSPARLVALRMRGHRV